MALNNNQSLFPKLLKLFILQGSSELYGDLLVHVSEPLSALFRKAHSLQVVSLLTQGSSHMLTVISVYDMHVLLRKLP